MRTNEIAKLANVHPNTVRLYEDWGYISPVPREQNGYRSYSNIHLAQMLIARYAFRQEFIQNNLRKKATAIVRLSGQEKFEESLKAAHEYYRFLQSELTYAQQAVQTANETLNQDLHSNELYTHQQVAQKLKISEETIRNWERNGLFTVARNSQNRRLYTSNDLQTLLVIRTLRSAHFSITSIRQLIESIDKVNNVSDLHVWLNNAKFKEEFYHVTDELEVNLKIAMKDVKSIIALLKDINL